MALHFILLLFAATTATAGSKPSKQRPMRVIFSTDLATGLDAANGDAGTCNVCYIKSYIMQAGSQ